MTLRNTKLAILLVVIAVFCMQPQLLGQAAGETGQNAGDAASGRMGMQGEGTDTGDTGAGARAADQADSAQPAGGRQGQLQGGFNQEHFVKNLMSQNQFEIQAGELAQQKASNEQVKQLAQKVAQTHQQAQQQLQQIAQSENIQAQAQLNPVHQAGLDQLRQLDGAEFDRALVYCNVASHQTTLLTLRDAASEAQSQAIRQYAQQITPKIRQHLQQAEQLAGWESARTAGETLQPGANGAGGMDRGDTGDATGAGAGGAGAGRADDQQ